MSAFKSQVKVEAESGEQVEAESGEKVEAERGVLLFCDQVPWWIKFKSSRQLYTSEETGSSSNKKKGDAWIVGGMTPTTQLIDTDVVFPLKAIAKIAEDDLRREMKAVAESKGERP